MSKLTDCCKVEAVTKHGTEYPDGPIGIHYTEEVCSKCGEYPDMDKYFMCDCCGKVFSVEERRTADGGSITWEYCGECFEADCSPTCADCDNFNLEDCTCERSGVKMNMWYKAGGCKLFQSKNT